MDRVTDDLVATMIRAKLDRECRVCRRAVVSDPEWRAITTLLGLGYGADPGIRTCSACVAKAQKAREQERERRERLQPARPPLGLRVTL